MKSETFKAFDHRRQFKGIVNDVLKGLKEHGEVITRPAVKYRLRTGTHDLTMKIYAELLEKYVAKEERDKQRVERNFSKVAAALNRKARSVRLIENRKSQLRRVTR